MNVAHHIAAVIPATGGQPGTIDWDILERGPVFASRCIKASHLNHPLALNNGFRIGFAVRDDGRVEAA